MKLEPAQIIQTVAEYFSVKESDLLSCTRLMPVVKARHVAIYYLREMAELSLRETGCFLKRNHASVIHAIKSVNDQCETNPTYRKQVEDIYKLLSFVPVSLGDSDEIWAENDYYPESILVKMDTITTLAS